MAAHDVSVRQTNCPFAWSVVVVLGIVLFQADGTTVVAGKFFFIS